MDTAKAPRAAIAIALAIAAESAHARGDGTWLLIVLLVVLAPIAVVLIQVWGGLMFTLAPIAAGLYVWSTGKGVTAFIVGAFLIALGAIFTVALAPPEVQERIEKWLK